MSQSPYVVQELPTHVAATMQALAQGGDPVYRVTVNIKSQAVTAYGQAHTLKPGMLAEADIVQDTRKLWEWALEPIFSVSGKLVSFAPSVRPTPHLAPSPLAGEGWGEGAGGITRSVRATQPLALNQQAQIRTNGKKRTSKKANESLTSST